MPNAKILFFILSLLTATSFNSYAAQDDNTPDLLDKIRTNGSWRVLVQLNFPGLRDEGGIDAEERISQRAAIAEIQEKVIKKVDAHNGPSLHRYKYAPLIAMEVDEAKFLSLKAQSEVRAIYEDKPVPPTLLDSVPLIGGDTAWSKGITGSGKTIAILDTGVDKNHAFLANKVVSEACFSTNSSVSTSLCPNSLNEQIGTNAGINCNADTACYHGTHVAGIAAGKGSTYSGVAKEADLISIQVFSLISPNTPDCTQSTPCVKSYPSDQIKALEYVYDLSAQLNIAAVNMSLGGGAYTYQCDNGYASIISQLRSVNIATVISSGNDGISYAISSPACVTGAISVGSTDNNNVVSTFSNSVSFLSLLAPGESITSSVPGGGYMTWDGTSMAAPHVAGALALLRSRSPSTVDNALFALDNSGVEVYDSRNGYTFSRINLGTLFTEAVSPTAPTITAASGRKFLFYSTYILTWTTSSDNSGVADYLLQFCLGGTCTNFTTLNIVPARDPLDTSLTTSVLFPSLSTIRFRVLARDWAGNISAASNIATLW